MAACYFLLVLTVSCGVSRSDIRIGVVAGAVPGHAGCGARSARGPAVRRAARALYRLLRLHARGPRAQPIQQGRGRGGQRAADDAQGLDLLLLFGMNVDETKLPPWLNEKKKSCKKFLFVSNILRFN